MLITRASASVESLPTREEGRACELERAVPGSEALESGNGGELVPKTGAASEVGDGAAVRVNDGSCM